MSSVSKRKRPRTAANGSSKRRRSAVAERAPGPVVGIGASAGGFEALGKFFGAMPPKTGLVFVVVVHLDPAQPSLMAELLGHVTGLTVEQAHDHQALEVDHVYVIPPNRTLTVEHGLIRLQEIADRRGLRGSIDHFFRSLAEAERDRAVAIVLSGTGTEGALGARAVKAEGGLVMAQSPETAMQSGMPANAIASGVVDAVLAPEQMPEALFAYLRDRPPNGHAAATPAARPADGLSAIVELLCSRSRYDFRGYRRETLERRIERRMGLQHVRSIDRYVEYLSSHPPEVDQLIKDLLSVPTGFFRDRAAWDELTTTLAALVRSHDPTSAIRVWAPGCSTGEEAYSLAIALAEQIRLAHCPCDLQVFATDMDEDALAVARAGSYPESIARDVTPQRLERFFTLKRHRYTIRRSIRDCVVFAAHNPTTDPPFSKLDLVSCRNALIHLEPQMQDKLLTLFHFMLNPGGYLFLGGAEGLRPREELFEPLSRRRRIFRSVAPATRARLELPAAPAVPDAGRFGPKTAQESIVAALADRRLLEHFAAAAVLVRPTGEILRFYGALARYLQLPRGVPSLDVIQLARDELRPTLREALHEATRQHRQIVLEAPDLIDDHHPGVLRITVRPVNTADAGERLWLVIFEEAPPPAERGRTAQPRAEHESQLVRRLRSELRVTRQEHRHLFEQLEGGTEKLKATHEEVTSMNEQLQSTNEELTTSKEELQSMNEDLTSLNTQLEDNVTELTAANDDLANLLVSTDNTTVIVDAELRIKRFTAGAAGVLNLLPADMERPLTDIATNLVDVDLALEARGVFATLQPVEKELATTDGRHYLLRALPYRTRERQVQGVVLTLVDVSTLKQAESELRAARALVAEDLRCMTHLHDLGERLAIAEEPPAALEEILRAAIEITGAEMGTFQLPDPAGALTITAQVGFEQPLLDHSAQPGPHSGTACGRVPSSGRRVIIEDVTTSAVFADSPWRPALLAAGVRAVQSTPLFDRSGQFLGIFSTHYRTPHRFGEPELRWLDLLARHAGEAIERWRTEESLRHSREGLEHRVAERTRWLTLLHQISEAANQAPTWDSALQRLLECICTTEEWQIGYVYLPDAEAPNVIAPAIAWLRDERFRPFHELSARQRYARGESLPGRVYAQGVPSYLGARDELWQAIPIRSSAARQAGLQAAAAHPIIIGREVIAVLELFSDRAVPRTEWFENLLPAVADQIARILERERATARMADLVWREQQELLHTLHDSLGQTLTGLGMLSAGLRQRLSAHGEAAETATEIARQAQQALEQVRQLSRSLFPIEVEAASLTSALQELAFATQSLHKIQVRVDGHVPESFSDGGAATQLYRIAQEAVTNAVKHARARSITIQIGYHGGMLRLRVADDGIGIGKPGAASGIGLQIMRYRAHSIGGILTVEPGSQGGTVVTCTLRTVPVRRAAPAPTRQASATHAGSG